MPTYDYRCTSCAITASVVQSIESYCREKRVPDCPQHGRMERHITVAPGFSGLANALAGDRHYDGMRASDGTDISSRTKHREYMKSRGLTTADDFKGTWKKTEAERTALRQGTFQDKDLRADLTKQVHLAGNKTE